MGQICSFCNPSDGSGEEQRKGVFFEDIHGGEWSSDAGGTSGTAADNAASRSDGVDGHGGQAGGKSGSSSSVTGQLPGTSGGQPQGRITRGGIAGGISEDENDVERRRQRAAMELEAERALREEQSRLDAIISTAGKDMVPVVNRRLHYSSVIGVGGAGGGLAGVVGVGGHHHDYPGSTAAIVQELSQSGRLAEVRLDTSSPSDAVGVSGSEEITPARPGEGGEEEGSSSTWFRGKVPRTAVRNSTEIVDVLSRGRWDGVALGTRGGPGGCGGEDPDFFFDDCAEGLLSLVLPGRDLFQGCAPIVENLP